MIESVLPREEVFELSIGKRVRVGLVGRIVPYG